MAVPETEQTECHGNTDGADNTLFQSLHFSAVIFGLFFPSFPFYTATSTQLYVAILWLRIRLHSRFKQSSLGFGLSGPL